MGHLRKCATKLHLCMVDDMTQYTGSTLSKRQFFGHWRWVHLRICSNCGHEVRILGNDTRRKPELPPGAIRCPKCEHNVPLG